MSFRHSHPLLEITNGLVPDSTRPGAATGFALSAYPVGVERGFITRNAGVKRTLLYVLGLASPTHPLPEKSYRAWTRTYKWRSLYGHEFLYAGPLFVHQLSHMWIDFRNIQDEYMRNQAIDYFENRIAVAATPLGVTCL